MRSSRSGLLLVCLTGLVGLALGAWFLLGGSPCQSPLAPLPRAMVAYPAASQGDGPGSGIRTVPFDGRERVVLQVIDRVTTRPLQDVRVRCDGARPSCVAAISDARGHARVPAAWLAAGGALEFELPADLGGRRFRRTPAPPDGLQVVLPALARIEVVLERGARAEIIPCPEFPDDADLTPETMEVLRSLRGKIPASYLLKLRDLGLAPEQLRILTGVQETDEALAFHLPWSGSVMVCGYGPARAPVHEAARTRCGETVRVTLRLREKPVVSGRVRYADGRPAGGIEVTVSCKAWFLAGSVPPRGSHEAGNPAFIYMGKRGSDDMQVHAILSTRTDVGGCFELAMPYTSQVVAYVLLKGHEPALDRRHADSPNHAVQDLLLTLRRPNPPRYMLVRTGSDTAAANIRLRLLQYSPPDEDQIQIPILTTDNRGRLDVTWLTPGVKYYFMPGGEESFSPGLFTCKAGATLQLDGPTMHLQR